MSILEKRERSSPNVEFCRLTISDFEMQPRRHRSIALVTHNSRSALLYYAALFLSVIGVATGGWWNEAAGLQFLCLAVTVGWLGWMIGQRNLVSSFPLLGFWGMNFFSWSIGFSVVAFLLPTYGFVLINDPVTTSAILLIALTAMGATHVVWSMLFRVRSIDIQIDPNAIRGPLFASGFACVGYWAVYLIYIGIDGRWEIGNFHTTGSMSYVIVGFKPLSIFFPLLLGASLRPKLMATFNVTAFLLLLGQILLMVNMGGRLGILQLAVYFIVGAFFSQLSAAKIARIAAVAALILSALLLGVGVARSSNDFASASAVGRMELTWRAVVGSGDGSPIGDSLMVTFGRLFEPTGQLVIENVSDSRKYVYFENFERLGFLFVPRFLSPNKAALQDGEEGLMLRHGQRYDNFSNAPMTYLASSYERFGIISVVLFYVIAAILLIFFTSIFLRIEDPAVRCVMLGYLVFQGVYLHRESVLGFLGMIFYETLKTYFMAVVVVRFGGFFAK